MTYYARPIIRTWTRLIDQEPILDMSFGDFFQCSFSRISEQPLEKRKVRRRIRNAKNPVYVLAFDTETTTDERQRLRYGAFRLTREHPEGWLVNFSHHDKDVNRVTGIFWEEELPEHEKEVIRQYCSDHDYLSMSRHDFVHEYLNAYGFQKESLILGYNLPFDISRIAIRATTAKNDPDKFTFRLFDNAEGEELKSYPGIQVKKIASHKAFINWTTGFFQAAGQISIPKGKFIDISQAVNAYSGLAMPLTLADAAERYHTEHRKTSIDYDGPVTNETLDYCVNDVLVTCDIYQAVKRQHQDFHTVTPLEKIYSTASLSKSLLGALGVTPPLTLNPEFPSQMLGYCMAGFYGGRTEAHFRGTPVPGIMVDQTSMYPTVGSLMRLTDFVTAQKINAVDDTAEIISLLKDIAEKRWIDKDIWPKLTGIALAVPHEDILPFRASYGETDHNIAVTNITTDSPLPYFLPDLAASCVLTGKVPQIVRAWRFQAEGRQLTLRGVKLPGNISLNLKSDDLFRTLVEQRQNYRKAHCKGHLSEPECIKQTACEHCAVSLFLKILANALYGIFAEIVRQEYVDDVKIQCWGANTMPWITATRTPELPGNWCFPPLAGLFVSGARLMLAMLEHTVTEAGGTYATTDTDSMFIISTPNGNMLPDGTPSLKTDQVKEICEKFESVSPYTSTSGIRMLKKDFPKEAEYGLALPISSKRYALLDLNGNIVKQSDHGLGHLMAPALNSKGKPDRTWKNQAWNWLRDALAGKEPVSPSWFSHPAVRQHTVATPRLYAAFNGYNKGKTYQDQIKPFNFIMTALLRNPPGFEAPRLIAPFTSDVRAAMEINWINLDTQETYKLARIDWENMGQVVAERGKRMKLSELPLNYAIVKTYEEVLNHYGTHPERKAAGSDGRPSGNQTAGLLSRLNIKVIGTARHIGKETNYAAERTAGVRTKPAEYQNVYTPDADFLNAREILRQFPAKYILENWRNMGQITPPDISEREMQRILAGTRNPTMLIRKACIQFAHNLIYMHENYDEARDYDNLATRLEWHAAANNTLRKCPNCGGSLTRRQKTCSAACRKAQQRKAA